MIRSVRRAVLLGTAIVTAALGAQAASATAFMFTGSNSSATAGNALSFSSNDGSGLNLSVYGGHLSNTSGGLATSSGATVATWANYGMGVLYGNDSTSNGTHQIDNASGGVDYVALVFNQAVTLSQFAVQAYGGSGVGRGMDAQFRTYSGSVSDLFSGNKSLWEGYFLDPNSSTTGTRGNTGTYTMDTTGSSASSNIWLVSADTTQTNDAFKLLGVGVDKTVGSVPEPASWALMIVGFGMVGSALRRRRGETLANA